MANLFKTSVAKIFLLAFCSFATLKASWDSSSLQVMIKLCVYQLIHSLLNCHFENATSGSLFPSYKEAYCSSMASSQFQPSATNYSDLPLPSGHFLESDMLYLLKYGSTAVQLWLQAGYNPHRISKQAREDLNFYTL